VYQLYSSINRECGLFFLIVYTSLAKIISPDISPEFAFVCPRNATSLDGKVGFLIVILKQRLYCILSMMIRYADDFVCAFQFAHNAERF
jgi:hypothetical protein